MKTINHLLPRIVVGVTLGGFLMTSYSCVQENASADNWDAPELNAVYAKGKKARPIKAQLDFVFDFQNTALQNIVLCPGTPTPPPGQNPIALFQTIVSGNMSHLGNLQPGTEFDDGNNVPLSGSYLVPQTCDGATFPVLVTTYDSFYVAANGDMLYAQENVFINFATGTFQGTAIIQGGTGRFSGATGSWDLIGGTFDGVGASWEISGEMTY